MNINVTDFTENGRCSNCGKCCSDILPLSRMEIDRIKRYIKTHGIREQRHNGRTGADLTCPFRDEKARKCLIYKVRPDICRVFMCNYTAEDIARAKIDFHEYRQPIFMRQIFYGNREQAEYIDELIEAFRQEAKRNGK